MVAKKVQCHLIFPNEFKLPLVVVPAAVTSHLYRAYQLFKIPHYSKYVDLCSNIHKLGVRGHTHGWRGTFGVCFRDKLTRK